MPTELKHNSSNQEEVDLLYLFIKLGEFIKKSIRGLIKYIGVVLVFLLRKWYYFAIAATLTAISALILNSISPSYYSTDLIIRSNAAHNQPIMSSLNKLGKYANARNFAALSTEINLDIEDASAIKSLQPFWYYDIGGDGIFDGIDTEGRFLSDTNVVIIDSVFVLHATIYDPNILMSLEEGLVHYLEANPFFEALNKQRLSDLDALLKQTEYEIAKLDSLQKREYYTNPDDLRQKDGQIVFTSEKVVRMYHSQMFQLLQLKQDCERDLNLYKDVVTVLEGFTEPVEPENGTTYYAKKLVWFYLGLALLLAVIITFRKKIWVR